MMRPVLALSLLVLAAAGCGRTVTPAPTPAPPVAPWSGGDVAPSAVPQVYFTVWAAAENRRWCALLAPVELGADVAAAQPRAATFGGGWGVAYDLPDQRSAFGVAGTGASAWSGNVYDEWPHKVVYADSSRVGYGTEGGGAGPRWLAYVRIPGQECLYNVWSLRGREHLETLLAGLRFIRTR